MSREIKFRCWDMVNKQMIVEKNIDILLKNINNNKSHIYQQYTGLKDKNGVEIYEGDIVKDGASDVGRLWEISITPEYGITFTLLADKNKIYYYEDFNKYHQDNLEVVGEKHQNLELLGSND